MIKTDLFYDAIMIFIKTIIIFSFDSLWVLWFRLLVKIWIKAWRIVSGSAEILQGASLRI